MLKKITLLLLLVASSTAVIAQGELGPITITHGKEIEADKEKIVKIAGEANGKIYTLATKGKNFYIKVFNSTDMDLISVNEIEMDDFIDKEPVFEEIAVLNDKIYIIGSVYDRKNKINNLLAVEISEDGKLTTNTIKLFSTEVTKNREKGAFYFKHSPNQDKLLIMHASLFDKEEIMQYEIKLVNENLDIVTSHLERVSFEDRKDLEFTIADFDLTFEDDIFLVINESYRDRKAKKNIEKFEVHAFKKASDYNQEVINIDFTGKEVINCEMLMTANNTLNLVGFYSSVNKRGKANWKLKGIYSATINASSNEVTNLKFNVFDFETKAKLIGERRAKKDKDIPPYYSTHSLIEKEDGGLIFLAEYRQSIIGRSSGIGIGGLGISFTPITFFTNEIIVTSLNADGSVEWANVIAKDQKASFTTMSVGMYGFSSGSNFSVGVGVTVPLAVLGKGPEYLGAIPIYTNGELTVVFNDNKKNMGVTDIEEIKSLGNYNKAIPTAFMFNKDNGDITRIDPEELQKDQLILRPGVYHIITNKEYLIYSSRRSEDKLGRMIIN
ncbi:hypothetical protein ACFS29_08010 [Psychroserpens luteus]|uniref:Uncharacterized protein n=1 Tax=Psychroserpens luteus TaxID=1434066 RepID=A0ABW5ZVA7_9FLAO|nr:hypothetical protein [uncultured Psychroserpens sp.]